MLTQRQKVAVCVFAAKAVAVGYIIARKARKSRALFDAQKILELWFGGDPQDNYRTKWFPSAATVANVDNLIAENFGALLARASVGRLTELWSAEPETCVALIVLLDQFSRHIYRHADDREERVGRCDAIALSVAERFVQNGWQRRVGPMQLIFALMPFRHSPSEERLSFVLKEVGDRSALEGQHAVILEKFRRTTLRRLQALQDAALPGDDVLEHHPFKADEADMAKHKLVRTVEAFLREHIPQDCPALAVSLSGGVDSMALCKVLLHLAPKFKYDKVVAVHIDYANRQESGQEADFVHQWCSDLGVVFVKRVVSEVTRGVTAREEYERMARAIRYDTYLQVIADHGCPGILVGHHRGDVQENVISNTMKGASLLNLSGMDPTGRVNGVSIWRPMLPLNKNLIFDFAHRYGVPYFKDTTPSWSTRGRLRRRLVPLLHELYGDGALENLSALAEDSRQMRDLADTLVFRPFLDAVVFSPLGACFDALPFRGRPLFFWKEALKVVVHPMGMPAVREKALEQFLHVIGHPNDPMPKDMFLEMRTEYRTCTEGGSVSFFRPEVFPKISYSEQFAGKPIPLGGEEVKIGPWLICARVVTEPPTGRCSPPFTSTKQFMEGCFSHFVTIDTADDDRGAGLVVQSAAASAAEGKRSPWRGVPTRLRDAVPRVGPQNVAGSGSGSVAGSNGGSSSSVDGAAAVAAMAAAAQGLASTRVVRVTYRYDTAGAVGRTS